MQLTDMRDAIRAETTASTSKLPDATIDRYVGQTVRMLERGHPWSYLDRFVEFTLAETKRSVTFPSSRVKRWDFLRIVTQNADGDDEFTYLSRVDPVQFSGRGTDTPTGFWFDSRDYIWFDNTADEDYTCEASFAELTDIASVVGDDDFEPWLMLQCQDLVIAQTIMNLSSFLRWPKVKALYKPDRDEALTTALDADLEFLNSGAALARDSMRMQYA